MSSKTSFLSDGTSEYSAVITISSFSIIISVLASLATIYCWNSKMMQHTRPILTIQKFVGCILLSISCIVFTGENSSVNCATRVYLFNISFTFVISAYLIKAITLYNTLILSFQTKDFNGTNVIIQTLPMIPFLAIDVILVSCSLFVGNSRGATSYQDGDNTYCGYNHNEVLFGLELGYKSILIVVSWWYAYALRHVLSKFAAIYFVDSTLRAILGSAVLAVWRLGGDVPTAIVFASAAACFCSLVTAFVNTIPVVMILTMGDQEAIGGIVEDLFDAKKREEEVT